jgi:hypothetical protein
VETAQRAEGGASPLAAHLADSGRYRCGRPTERDSPEGLACRRCQAEILSRFLGKQTESLQRSVPGKRSIHSFTTKAESFTTKDCERTRNSSGGHSPGILTADLALPQRSPIAIGIEAGAGNDRQLGGGGRSACVLTQAGPDGFQGSQLVSGRPARQGRAALAGRTWLTPGLRELNHQPFRHDLQTLVQHPAATSRGEVTQADERNHEDNATAEAEKSGRDRQTPRTPLTTRRWAAAPGCAADRCPGHG